MKLIDIERQLIDLLVEKNVCCYFFICVCVCVTGRVPCKSWYTVVEEHGSSVSYRIMATLSQQANIPASPAIDKHCI